MKLTAAEERALTYRSRQHGAAFWRGYTAGRLGARLAENPYTAGRGGAVAFWRAWEDGRAHGARVRSELPEPGRRRRTGALARKEETRT